MPYFLSPIGNSQILDANGNPLVGGTIETYLANTSTPATTYTDNTSGTAQGVVMTLNSLGLPTLGPVWMLGGVPLKFIIKNASGVVQPPTQDDISGIGDSSNVTDEWLLFGGAPTYISATSFSLDGDQTNTFQINRRLKSTNTGGTVYSTISNASFGAGITTVTVTNTSGALDSGLTAVSYGMLSSTNPSIPILPPSNLQQPLTIGTAQATTSGTSIDFTGIPSWAKKIVLSFAGISVNGTSALIIQLGDSGGVETTGYLGGSSLIAGSVITSNYTTGIALGNSGSAATLYHGAMTLTLISSATNTWVATCVAYESNSPEGHTSAGSKPLSATLDRIRITTLGGANTFDAGVANIIYEG